jgi:hypothetical protein
LSKILSSSTPETPIFNLTMRNFSIIQEFISDNSRLTFSTSTFDSLTIYVLELFTYVLFYLAVKTKSHFLIKC